MNLDAGVFVALLALFAMIGIAKNRKIQSEESYLFAERKCGLFGLTCTLIMTELNTATLLAFAGLGYIVGLRALFLPLIFLIGLVFYGLSVAKKYKELNASSVTALLRERYGKPFAQLASIFLIGSMMGFTATYVKSVTLIFSPVFPMWNGWILSGYLVLVILLMTLRGGLIAIIRTDITSFLLICLIFPLFLFYTKREAGVSEIQSLPNLLPHRFIISLVILTMFTYILAPWYGQKIFSAKSKRVAFSAVILAAIFVFIFYGVGVLSTAYLKASGIVISSPDMAIPAIINLYFPTGLKGVAYATLFMISGTTLAGVWSAMSSMVITDFGRSSTNYRQGLLLTLLFAATSYVLGNTLVDKILDKLILANIPVAALSFALLAGFYWKKASTTGAVLSSIIGFSWGLFCFLYFGEKGLYTWYWALWGIPLIFGSGILGSFLSPSKIKSQLKV
jgi:Na+/proline symporter